MVVANRHQILNIKSFLNIEFLRVVKNANRKRSRNIYDTRIRCTQLSCSWRDKWIVREEIRLQNFQIFRGKLISMLNPRSLIIPNKHCYTKWK